MMEPEELIKEACALLGCDTGRLIKLNRIFFVMGHFRESKGEWYDNNNKPVNFDYTEEHAIASGKTLQEVWQDIQEYHRKSKLTMEEYLREVTTAEPSHIMERKNDPR